MLLALQLSTSIASFFAAQGSFYSFYGNGANAGDYTLGYYFFVKVIASVSFNSYPYASAAGILFTLIAAPLTLITRRLFIKYGPSEN